ncbi:MAG: hypothetical protein H8D45_22515 [Bacteroidetes bacterium]|nr:hypothetical protein [Bacteroidota bacterium]MBL7104067.1 hypothetical protein [Bacteroidales bacterium]
MINGSFKTGIVIQARSSSSRLPKKLLLPFFGLKSIIDILLINFKTYLHGEYDIVLATSNNKQDDIFVDIADKYKMKLYRGPETDVLQRIINAADNYGFKNIIRVCPDNPIFDIKGTVELLKYHLKYDNDYTGYQLKGYLPSIKSHMGFWGEIVSLSALRRVHSETNKKIYLEHVTNYIYNHSEKFKVCFRDAPEVVYSREDIRLTVDTKEDFFLMQEIYQRLLKENIAFEVEQIIHFLDQNPRYLLSMKNQIEINKK